MSHLDFNLYLAILDIWIRLTKNLNSLEYYEYILLYTNDALVMSEEAKKVPWDEIRKYFELKPTSIRLSKLYLGGLVRKVQLDNSVLAWAFESS